MNTNANYPMRTLAIVAGCVVLSSVSLMAADAKENWAKHCMSCHGKDGKGQTKAGKMADVKDLTDAAYQASFTDGQMIDQMRNGMKDKTGKERMKPFRDKLSDDEIKALAAFVRTLKK